MRPILRVSIPLISLMALLGCARDPEMIGGVPVDEIVTDYGVVEDGEYTLPPVPPEYLQGVNRRMPVVHDGPEEPGTIIVDPHAKFLYFVEEDGAAVRYPIAVGRAGLSMREDSTVGMKREWPGWMPTANMLRTQPEVYGPFADGVDGGLASPLGARALYLYQNGRDTFFRIHGTNDLPSIGNSGSAGCIRLFNHDIIDLYERVERGARVTVRTYEESVAAEGEALANRGVELPPTIIDPESIYGATDVDAEDESTDSDDDAGEEAAPDAIAGAEADETTGDA
ncbi:MAG: L,D-transpeptidase family protein [Alphaproteobacteria bacterium]|jgi:lipoprotein-anchoring transpeptidase ErfK/SrfK|nr:L,D-transpeptidase family protein [Alphaproteobacteria bacterium]